MSRVPYTVDIDNTVCSELEQMRRCVATHDFSLLPALIERVQFHASAMEAGLWARKNYHEWLGMRLKDLDNKELTQKDFIQKIRDVVSKDESEW